MCPRRRKHVRPSPMPARLRFRGSLPRPSSEATRPAWWRSSSIATGSSTRAPPESWTSGRNLPMPVNAIFNIASMTKPVTSVAIMMLLEEGKLQLDDPVSSYLSRLRQSSGHHEVQRRRWHVRDATGQAGDDDPPPDGAHFGHRLRVSRNPIVARLQRGVQKSEWELPLLHDPGDRWTYSASTRVLGLIVEKITGVDRSRPGIRSASSARSAWSIRRGRWRPTSSRGSRPRTAGRAEPFRSSRATPIASRPTPPFRGDGGLYSTVQRLRACSSARCSTEGASGSTKMLTERSVKMMGGEPDWIDRRRAAARRGSAADEALSTGRRSRQVRPRLSDCVQG